MDQKVLEGTDIQSYLLSDLSRVNHQYNKLNVKFRYNNNNDLSKHRIRYSIVYEDKV